MNTDTRWAVEAHGLVKTFGEHRAVDGVDLKVRTGSVYGFLGPNGAGKTTTLRMLATLLRPNAGTATIFGHDIVKDPLAVRRLIGVTGQNATVDPSLTVTENLVLFGRLLGLTRANARRRAAELLEEFGLTDASRKSVDNLSGGMRRRLDLSASLIAQPPLIFLDEPTTGLDPRTRIQMWDTIRRLVNNGSTVLLTTQYLEEADQLAERIAVIDRGTVVAEGTPNELKASVGASSLQLRLRNDADIARAVQMLRTALGGQAAISVEDNWLTAPLEAPDAVTELLIALRDAGIGLDEVSVQKPSMDDVFFALTGHMTSDSEETTDQDETNPVR